MKCSQCNYIDTKVIESRDVADGESIRRRRSCPKCNFRFTTYERIERPQVIVIKHSGTRELFNREKLMGGLYRACEKTTVSNVQIEQIASNIEAKIYALGEAEVSSSQIGQVVMDELRDVNEVAYVRFASVYRRFTDIAGFERELSKIRTRKAKKTS